MNRTHLGLLTLGLGFLLLRQTFLSWLEASRLLGGSYFDGEIVWWRDDRLPRETTGEGYKFQ